MSETETPRLTEVTAKIISAVFNPLFMPVYALLIIFFAPTLFGYLPFDVKKLLLLIVFVNNVLLPVSLFLFLKHFNIIDSTSVNPRSERVIPLILTSVLYIVTVFIIYRFPIPVFLKSFFFATCFLSLVVTLLNFWWKISLHSVGIGALIASVLILSFKMYSPLVWFLVASVITGGLVMSARLRLNLHNPQQVWFGFLTGFGGLLLFMLFL